MATVEFRCDSADKVAMLYNEDNDYYVARNADDADGTQSSSIYIGQLYTSPKYRICRGVFCWDTSGLNDNCLIVSATIQFYRYSGANEIDVIVKSGMPTYPHMPSVVGDYDLDHYSGNGGEATITANGIITLNSNGRDWINKTGNTKLAVLSTRDVDGLAPTANEEIYLYGYNGASYIDKQPKLTIEYALPTGSPAVTSEGPCTDRQSTTMTAVGTVTDDGGGYEARGFEYYEDDAKYDSEMYAVREKGVFTGTGEYEMTINGLKPETTYQIRAWIKNVYGLVYGDWYTCTTTAVLTHTYDIYTEANAANYSLYVSDDEAIAWRGYRGPYSGKQNNINITDLTNKTKGVKVLKIDPDAKGTFHVCIVVKQEIKS